MVRGFGLVLLCAAVLSADPLEDAARALARKVNGRLQNGDVVRLAVRNLSALPESEAARVRAGLEKSLRRPARPGAAIDVMVTLSSSQSEHLLVAEIRRAETRVVEMVTFQPAPAETPSALPVIDRKLIWTQEEPLLDLAIQGDRMVVLDARRLSVYRSQQGQWERVSAAALPPLPRDPRGRLEASAQGFTVILPSHRCVAEMQPELKVECTPGTAPPPPWNGSGDPESASLNACGGTLVVAASNRDWDQPDVLTAFQMNGGKAKAATAPLEVSGPVTALWPAADSALAIVKDLSTSRYAAYRLTIDCSR